MHKSLKHFIYLLSIWQERPAAPDKPAVWRISLENARTGQRHCFGSLKQTLAFLQDRTMGGIHMEPIAQEKGETEDTNR